MEKIFFKTENKLLFNTIKSIFMDIGLYEITDTQNDTTNIIVENNDTFIINDIVFKKPLYIKDLLKKNIFQNTFSFCNFLVNKENRKISFMENSATLTAIELTLLEILYNTTDGLSLTDILKTLGYSSISQSKTYATHIYNLRKKLYTLSQKDNIIIFENDKYKLNKGIK